MNFYLKKYGFLPPQLVSNPDPNLGIIIVIPCFNEPDLVSSLKSIAACNLPQKSVEVIVVINSGVDHSDVVKHQNQRSLSEMNTWLATAAPGSISFQSVWVGDLPAKHAGVGLARKIGMDEAVARFDKIGFDGVIVCFDADSLCDPNYLIEIENHFSHHQKSPGCSIYFEHPLEGHEHRPEIYQAITAYELHLRYYKEALQFCGLPFAFHTVGSSMAVRSSAYQKQGGMNKRKAGEDFYFLHKIIALGNFTELNTTRVIPSPRISDRVPFGTGRSIGDYVNNTRTTFDTYHLASFEFIREWVEKIPCLFDQNLDALIWSEKNAACVPFLMEFLSSEKFTEALIDVQKNSPSAESFVRRFYSWFDAFRVLKLVHFLRDRLFPNQPVERMARLLSEKINIRVHGNSTRELLIALRQHEKAERS